MTLGLSRGGDEGSTYVLDADGEHIPIRVGDRLNIPKGAWHAKGEVTERVTYITTLGEPVPLLEALTPLDPKGPFPS